MNRSMGIERFVMAAVIFCAIASAIALNSCGGGGGGGSTGDTLVNAENSVVTAVRNTAPMDVCPSGGISVDAGIDENGNGALDASEVDSTQYVCNGADGSSVLVSVVSESSGTNCTYGGKKVSVGLDADRDNVLDVAEISSTDYICNGAGGTAGSDGTDGTDGFNTLVSIVSEPIGTSCTYGGLKVSSGLDNGNSGGTARDGILQSGEVTSTTYVCDGAPGPTMPVIQSLYTTGVPAAPGGTITATVNAQSAEDLALTYSWAASAGWSIASGGTATTVTITAPGSRGANGTATVTVTDSQSRTALGTVALSTVGDGVPVAAAGTDQYVLPNTDVALDGSASNDPDGEALTYAWSVISTPPESAVTTTALSSSTVENPHFYADKVGAYKLSLVVNDGQANSAADTVTITCRIPIPDTGQTASYTATFGEDSDYETNPPSYTDNGDGTITDNVTGLLWQKCTNGLSGTACASGAVTASNWYQATGTYDATNNPSTTNVCGSLSLVGTGWRLPTDLELMTIVHYGPNPAINAAYFPATASPGYWSTTSFGSGITYAWYVNFNSGSVDYGPKSSSALYVRCVR